MVDFLHRHQERDRRIAWVYARNMKKKYGKPILNVGSVSPGNRLSKWNLGDVNCDILNHPAVPNFKQCDINNLSCFRDKEFSCVVVSHVLEHQPVNIKRAIKSVRRVGHSAVFVVPAWYLPWNFISDEHDKIFFRRLYFFEDGRPSPKIRWIRVG